MKESASAEMQGEANALIINGNENSESQREANSPSGNESQSREANASIENEHQDRALANDITQLLEGSEPPSSRKYCCIYRVPRDLRKLNGEAYTPQIISIGPFHHGHERLETLEKLKVEYFKRFVKKAERNIKDLVSYIRDRERDIRRCYSETSKLSSDNYVKMIMLDASFIIVFFLISKPPREWGCYQEFTVLPERLRDDILLLENQLPFFIIEGLYNFAFTSCSNYLSFTQLTFEYFAYYNSQKMSHDDPNFETKHLLDLLRTFFLPQSQRLPQRNCGENVRHLYTVSQLHEAGVKFKVSSSKCLFDLKFTNGVLKIPSFKIYRDTESYVRNLVALEQCHYFSNAYFTDYMRVFDFLVDTAKDVDLLVRKGIMVNWLGDSNAVATLCNNLCKHIFILDMNSDYSHLCKDLNTFYEDRRHRWKVILRRDYFSNPWRTTATIAATILLVVTFTQTVCSIISLS
ncbi:putative UPF0481 protein At3g02645 [Corylus avellana]|uniref:putative UPF0481 protein At3g02645 n=1 Tax=Corylus avellana TaxID=13451 RepID=UPI00286A4AB9|nr:putative UPF0481 protein At3g02645 [Corylus avellana]